MNGSFQVRKKRRPPSENVIEIESSDEEIEINGHAEGDAIRAQKRPRTGAKRRDVNENKSRGSMNKRKRSIYENPSSSSSGNRIERHLTLPSESSENTLAKAIALSQAQVDADIRRKQDEEYQMSMAMDRSKETRLQEEKEQEAMKQKEQLRLEQEARAYVERLKQTLEKEPDSDTRHVTLRLDVPSGRYLRRFPPDSKLQQLFIWIELVDERCRKANYQVCIPPTKHTGKQELISSGDVSAEIRKQTTFEELKLDRCCIRILLQT